MITHAPARVTILAFASLLLPSLVLAQNLLPTQSVTVQQGSNNLGQNNGHLQVQYSVNGQKVNQSTDSLITFDLSPLLASVPIVTASDVQSANLILFANSGGAGGNVTVCELAATPESRHYHRHDDSGLQQSVSGFHRNFQPAAKWSLHQYSNHHDRAVLAYERGR
jgi:hypothetical protein